MADAIMLASSFWCEEPQCAGSVFAVERDLAWVGHTGYV